MANPQTEVHAEAQPEADAEINPGVEADPRSDAEADSRFHAAANLTPVADTSSQTPEANWAQGTSSNGNAESCTGSHSAAGVDSNGNAETVRRAGSRATPSKHELEQQEVPVAKRHKAVSKASLAAMAAIAATARLPTQVITLVPLKLEHLPSNPECASVGHNNVTPSKDEQPSQSSHSASAVCCSDTNYISLHKK